MPERRRVEDAEHFDPRTVRQRPSVGEFVSKNWLIMILTSLVTFAGAGWMSYVQGEIGAVKQQQLQATEQNAQRAQDQAVIKEKVGNLERTTQEIRSDVKEQNKKLDELLRRSK